MYLAIALLLFISVSKIEGEGIWDALQERQQVYCLIMSDPLSMAAGIAGIVAAVAQVTRLLTRFIKSTIAAPQQAQVVLAEVSDIGEILSQLQSFLLGLKSPKRSRASLLKIDKIITIVSGCVLTFSELEKLLDEMKTGDLDVLDRLKWVSKESVVVDLIQRLQNHKASLSLVLNILNGFVFKSSARFYRPHGCLCFEGKQWPKPQSRWIDCTHS